MRQFHTPPPRWLLVVMVALFAICGILKVSKHVEPTRFDHRVREYHSQVGPEAVNLVLDIAFTYTTEEEYQGLLMVVNFDTYPTTTINEVHETLEWIKCVPHLSLYEQMDMSQESPFQEISALNQTLYGLNAFKAGLDMGTMAPEDSTKFDQLVADYDQAYATAKALLPSGNLHHLEDTALPEDTGGGLPDFESMEEVPYPVEPPEEFFQDGGL